MVQNLQLPSRRKQIRSKNSLLKTKERYPLYLPNNHPNDKR